VQRLKLCAVPLQRRKPFVLGVATSWAVVDGVLGDYNRCRAAQDVIMVTSAQAELTKSKFAPANDERASDLVFSNLDDVWPGWRLPWSEQDRDTVSGNRYDGAPWPTEPTELIAWALRSGAELWIPTTAELRSLWDAREAALWAQVDKRAEQHVTSLVVL
jgi:hypothetical protein